MNLNDILPKGISYQNYKKSLEEKHKNFDSNGKSGEELEKNNYIPLNLARMGRIDKTYSPSEVVIQRVSSLNSPQTWMILTEGWCGDSAQNTPYLYKIAELNPVIQLILVERDSNLQIMDQFLTDGKRSIPKLVVFSDSGEILFQWGSRPASAQAVVDKAKSEGKEKKDWEITLHQWYSQNKGLEL
ncbi:MAG: thioredoxin family protein, partial [Ignavibacteria bacterium]|nr:thioredoxin family protein [Ignavibacteria bacterium]